MPEDVRSARPLHARFDAGIATSRVVTTVFDQVLEDIHQGKLQPGERISDNLLAQSFGVSRTPVREALQRLREIGVVEASASRFTRVAVVSPKETAEAMVVWHALFDALLDEVIPQTDDAVLADMTRDHEAFGLSIANMDMQSTATANFAFFQRLSSMTTNASLRRAITSVVHIVRLGSLHLPDYLDFAALSHAQELFLEAVRAKDVTLAHTAMAAVRSIQIPQEISDPTNV